MIKRYIIYIYINNIHIKMSETIISMINECFEYSITEKNINRLMEFNLIKICELMNVDYGFIGEKYINDDNKIFFRYHALVGIMDEKINKRYNKNSYIDFFPQDDSLHLKVLETGLNETSVLETMFLDGHVKLKNLCIFPLKKNDTIIGLLGLSRKNEIKFTNDDIKHIEPFSKFIGNVLINIRSMEDLENHKMSFIANMSHEVRTPLNAIITMLDMLVKTELTSTQFNYIDAIKTCGIQLMDIVNDILDYSKIITSGLKLKLLPISINKCISGVYSMMLQKAKEKNIIFEYNISNDVPDMIIGDMTRIKQALMNIISNSIKFTKSGSVKLSVNLENISDNDCELQFIIKDTGIGIPQDKITKVFDAFRQIDNDYLSDICGVGLGLPITKHIAQLFNGSVWLDSKLNEGTTVYLTMKFKLYKNIIDIDKLKIHFKNKHILLLDNDPTEKILLYQFLSDTGIKPILASSSDEALIYLSNDIFLFEFLLININTVSDDDILKIHRLKNSTVKIIIVDLENHEKRHINYDYKISRPIDRNKLNQLLNLVYIGSQYQTKNAHNEIIINNKLHKISNINISEITNTIINKKINILVAEDNKQNQNVIIELLNSLGYTDIKVTDDGLETFNKLCEDNFDIAFIDLKMPILSGIDVALKFKQTCNRNTIIVAVTASLSDEVKKRCFDAGMDGFITKPIDKNDIETIINLIINNKL